VFVTLTLVVEFLGAVLVMCFWFEKRHLDSAQIEYGKGEGINEAGETLNISEQFDAQVT
jgi:hypothetical protein